MSKAGLFQEYTLAVGLGFVGTTFAGALFIAMELSLPGRTGLSMSLSGLLLTGGWLWVVVAMAATMSGRVTPIPSAGDPDLFVRQDLSTEPY